MKELIKKKYVALPNRPLGFSGIGRNTIRYLQTLPGTHLVIDVLVRRFDVLRKQSIVPDW